MAALRRERANLKAAIGGSDMEGGEAAIDGGLVENVRINPQRRLHLRKVPSSHGHEELELCGVAAAAQAMPHLLR